MLYCASFLRQYVNAVETAKESPQECVHCSHACDVTVVRAFVHLLFASFIRMAGYIWRSTGCIKKHANLSACLSVCLSACLHVSPSLSSTSSLFLTHSVSLAPVSLPLSLSPKSPPSQPLAFMSLSMSLFVCRSVCLSVCLHVSPSLSHPPPLSPSLTL